MNIFSMHNMSAYRKLCKPEKIYSSTGFRCCEQAPFRAVDNKSSRREGDASCGEVERREDKRSEKAGTSKLRLSS